MRIDLTSLRSRAIFFSIVLLLAGGLAVSGGTVWLAWHWGASSKPELWRKAARLEPGNADYWSRLGLYRQWDPDHGDIHQAVRDFQRATRTDPRSAGIWMDLGDAYRASGDSVRAGEAYEKAQADYPISPEVAWRYGSFLLYAGKYSEGYAEIRRALVVQPSLTASAISECWQANQSIGPILNDVLPGKPEYYRAALSFFLSKQLLDPALAVWNRQLSAGLPVEMGQAIPLVNALIDRGRMAEARQAWMQALKAANWPRDPGAGGSLAFNGDFEHAIANGGFGWREIPVSGARFASDNQIAHSGSQSIRIEFDGTANLDFQNLFQYVPVRPATRYHFSAYLRTEKISTDSGVRFEILDPRHPSRLQMHTPNVVGTTPWTSVQADILTGPDTDLLEIALRRVPTEKFDNKLRGTAWVDDVALSPAPALPKGGSR